MALKTRYEAEEYQKRLKKLQQFRRQARISQAVNRTDQAIDEDLYDGIQIDPEDIQIMLDRNQSPMVFNVVKNTLNWILGTERKSRIDWRVLPRKKDGASAAKHKTKLMKYVQDASKGEYARSQAFTEACLAGVGWLEYGARNTDEILFMRSERWRNMWYDHLAMGIDGSDMRYVFREKWIDLDIAVGMFPENEDELNILAEAVNSLYPYHPDDITITDQASEFDLESELDSFFSGTGDDMRERVKIVEMQYRIPKNIKIMHMKDDDTPFGTLDGVMYREKDPDHQYLVNGGYFTTTDANRMVVHHAIWAGRTLLQDDITPYNHNRFTFVPIFCYRRSRDNMPYGVIRDLRDPQSDLNARKSKSLFLLNANQIVIEKDATDDVVAFHAEMQRPDGIGMVNQGKMEAWKQIAHETQIGEHAQIAQDDERFIHSISGVTPDSEWQKRKDLSGKAMDIQENQSLTAHGVVFDNYYYAIQVGGEILLSNVEQFYDREKEIRITGDQHKDEFVKINARKPDGSLDMDSSIIANKADFIVGKQDYRETVRKAMSDQLMTLITNISKASPDVALALLDLAVELMDELPNKDEAVARIRKINNQHAPEDELNDQQKIEVAQQKAQVQQQAQAQQQYQQALQELQMMGERLKNMETKSKTDKNSADAMIKKLEGFIKALEAAGVIGANPHIVAAADSLVLESQNIGQGGPQE